MDVRQLKYGIFRADQSYAKRQADPAEIEHPWRSKFERDRDRILYSKGFHRLFGKTQIFTFGTDDHIRNRLTHTLEVSQIATTLSSQLMLDRDLAEAIALGHDLGHTPFGHVGERTLNAIMNNCIVLDKFGVKLEEEDSGFKHNWQSVRMVEEYEKLSPRHLGLNLTGYTLWGLQNHSSGVWRECNAFGGNGNTCSLGGGSGNCNKVGKLSVDYYRRYANILDSNQWTIEAFVVMWADEIAQRHHDVIDGLQRGIVTNELLYQIIKDIFKDEMEGYKKAINGLKTKSKDPQYDIAAFSKWIVNFYVNKIVALFKNELDKMRNEIVKREMESFEEFKNTKIEMQVRDAFTFSSTDFGKMNKALEKELRSYILNSYDAQSMDGRGDYIVRKLFEAYLTNPQQMSDGPIIRLGKDLEIDGEKVGEVRNRIHEMLKGIRREEVRVKLCRVITDYIASMTDAYAVEKYQSLYGIS